MSRIHKKYKKLYTLGKKALMLEFLIIVEALTGVAFLYFADIDYVL